MFLQCPINKFDLCREHRCAMWDKNRVCCGLITQPSIDAENLVYWMQDKLYTLESRRHD